MRSVEAYPRAAMERAMKVQDVMLGRGPAFGLADSITAVGASLLRFFCKGGNHETHAANVSCHDTFGKPNLGVAHK